MCVCSLRYLACNAHVPYYHLRPVRVYHIFPHYLINGTIFEKKTFIEHKMYVLIFSTTFVWHISHSKKNGARYNQKRPVVFMCSTCDSCPILMKVEFPREFFFSQNTQIWNFMKICPVGAELFHLDRRTDRHDKANSLFSQFCESVQKVKSSLRRARRYREKWSYSSTHS